MLHFICINNFQEKGKNDVKTSAQKNSSKLFAPLHAPLRFESLRNLRICRESFVRYIDRLKK